MKKFKPFISVLLICTLTLSFASLSLGNLATASTGAGNFLPNVFYDRDQNGFDTKNEIDRSQITFDYVTYLFESLYGYGYCYERINSTAQKVNYQAVLSNLQNYDNIIFFSKGHRTEKNGEIGIIPNHTVPYPDVSSYLLSSEIYSRTSSKNVVTFMWHCRTAQYYPGNGLPYAFTHNSILGYYGGTGDEVFLGWEDNTNFHIQWPNGTIMPDPNQSGWVVGSPQYEWKMTPTNDFGRVAELYWYYMSRGYQTNEALNKATNAIYGVNFTTSYLIGWLVIWGNKYMVLP